MADIKIISGNYKGYTGRLLGGKRKDPRNIFGSFHAGTQNFFVSQLVVTSKDNFNIGDTVSVKDGFLQGFKGKYAGYFKDENSQLIITLDDLTGSRVVDIYHTNTSILYFLLQSFYTHIG